MAIGANTIWRIRPGGSDNNGAGWDPTIAGAGTPYNDQDSPQLSFSGGSADLRCDAGSTTLTSVTGGFTSAMVGNAIRITAGTNVTVGYYFITGYTNTNTVTIDRTVHATLNFTGGTGYVGGAGCFANPGASMLASSNATGNKAVVGNVVYIYGSGSDDPTSNDYTLTNSLTSQFGGTTSSATVRIIGENGRPRIGISNNATQAQWSTTGIVFDRIYFAAGYTGTTEYYVFSSSGRTMWIDCVIDLNQKEVMGINLTTQDYMIGCLVRSYTSAQTTQAGQHGVNNRGNTACIYGCVFRHLRGDAITGGSANRSMIAVQNLIYGCAGSGIHVAFDDNGTPHSFVVGNVIVSSSGNSSIYGIRVNQANSPKTMVIYNNIIVGFNGTSAVAISTNQTTEVTQSGRPSRYNAFYNNTSNYDTYWNGGTQHSSDVQLTSDPFVSSTDFTLNSVSGGGAAIRDAGFPSTMPGLSTTNPYISIGFSPATDAGAGSNPVGINRIIQNIGTY